MRLLALLLLSAFTSAAAEPAPPSADDQGAAWYAAYDRDSRLASLPGGRALNLYCTGQGSPTVLLEPGIGQTAYTWWKVQDRMARLTRVCAYDRAGTGRSPVGPMPRDTAAEVSDLEALLKAADIRGPYVLVGHSMGGYNARLFASLHSKDVAGLVLIDPSVENQLPIMEAALPTVAKNDKNSLRYIHYCAKPTLSDADFSHDCVRAAPKAFPPELAAKFSATQTRDYYRTFESEGDGFINRDSAQVIAHRHTFGSTPLIVLTRGELSTDLPKEEAEKEHQIWSRLHDDVAKLSSRGSNRLVEGSGHYIQFDKPDVVVAAVAEVVNAARAKPPKRR